MGAEKHYLEHEHGDPETNISVFANRGGGLTVAVEEEKAMDSYNQTFTCTISLTAAQAIALRDYLVKWFPVS